MHLVLVHGAWHGGWCWEEHFTGYLAKAGHTTTALTLPGHESRAHRQGRIWNTMPNYVEAVRKAVTDISEPVVIVAHSMGGLVTQRLLEDSPPANVKGAALLASSPAVGAGLATLRAGKRDFAGVATAVVTANMWPIVRDNDAVRAALFSPDTPSEIVEKTAEHLVNESYLAYLSMILRTPRPSKVTTPMLVVAAGQDGLFTIKEQRNLAKKNKARFVELPNSGHDIMLDTSWQAGADAITEWLPTIKT